MTTTPDALLFTTPGCAHCTSVLHGLNELVAEGLISELTVIDATQKPELAAKYGVKTAPWLRLGPFTLIGSYGLAELRQWAEWAHGEEGAVHYVEHLLTHGSYQQAKAFIDIDTQRLKSLLSVVADPSARLENRLGVSALLESHAFSPSLQNLLPQLLELTKHPDHRVRADACHLLGLTGNITAVAPLEACLSDIHEEVREIAAEALETIKQHQKKS